MKGHSDVRAAQQSRFSIQYFKDNNVTLNSASEPVFGFYYDGDEVLGKETEYAFEVAWISPDCQQAVSDPYIYDPFGGAPFTISGTEIFEDTFNNCDNTGVGGYMDVGCLRYNVSTILASKGVPMLTLMQFIGGLGDNQAIPADYGWIYLH